jgi:hypothetical protein
LLKSIGWLCELPDQLEIIREDGKSPPSHALPTQFYLWGVIWPGDCRVSKNDGSLAYFVIEVKTVAVQKEYKIRRHYESKHASKCTKYPGKHCDDELEAVKPCVITTEYFCKGENKKLRPQHNLIFEWCVYVAKAEKTVHGQGSN